MKTVLKNETSSCSWCVATTQSSLAELLHLQMSNLPSSGSKMESVTDLRWRRTSGSRQFLSVKSVPTTRSHWGNRFFFPHLRADVKFWHAYAYCAHTHTLHTCVCLVYRSIEACDSSERFRSHLPHLHLCTALMSFYLRALLFLSKYLCLTANLSLFISAKYVRSARLRRLLISGEFMHVAALRRGA